jgi:hypothetical protein
LAAKPDNPVKKHLILPLFILLGLSVLIGLQRLHTWHEPLERDLTIYAVIGHELLAGRSLYSDLCENKPPAIFVTYAAAEWLAGYGPTAIYLMGTIAAIITLLGIYRVGYSLSSSIGTGLWAAIFWTAICSDLRLQANQPNTEVFINACVIWAFALLLKTNNCHPWLWRYLLIGALLSIASLYKTVVIGIAAILGGMHLAFPPGDPPDRRLAIKQVSVMAVVGGAAWALVFIYFAAVGHFKDFYEIVFTFNRYYTGSIVKNIIIGTYSFKGFITFIVFFIYTIFIVLIKPNKSRRPWLLLLGLIIGSHIAVILPGKYYPHYYQYWLPIIAVTAAWTIEELGGLVERYSLWIKCSTGFIILICMVAYEFPNYKVSPEEWSRKKYTKYKENFVESKEMGEEIRRILKPGETFYVWGAESGLYYYSRLSPPTGVIFFWHLHGWNLHGWPCSSAMISRVIKDLEKAQPELFLIPERMVPLIIHPNPVLSWFSTRYRPFSLQRSFILFARRGGQLESRIGKTGEPGKETLALIRGNELLNRIKALSPGQGK